MIGFSVSGPNTRLLSSSADFADEQDCGTLTSDPAINWQRTDRASIAPLPGLDDWQS
ncbi:hypothetical protein OLZ32_36940 [Rhizobium sp. 1AS11]|uniref:hypothetical protein n=1 Tax=Rhizobium acaciae TaxID=2989736 RepID=UPI002221D9D6|nr:hypothetical protein [Rhizobium acaciae]MCW1413808.1 hypothetical protein [Rhizobium acaciae]MCW1745945.1 hypothetical protein [Rhizobium acaciae]